MTQNSLIQIAAVILLSMVIASLSLFVVKEGEEALVIRFGEILGDKKNDLNEKKPGLHLKLPIIDKVNRISTKLQTIEAPKTRVLTAEQKSVDVDYFIKWKVADLEEFYKSISTTSIFGSTAGFMNSAAEIIQAKVAHEIRTEFGKRTLSELISGDRGDVINTLRDKAQESVQILGINIIDVRIKRIDYPRDVTKTVYERMSSQRKQFATLYRANGEAEAEKLRSSADKTALIIIAEAENKSANTRAEGDAEAAKIYNDAYSQNKELYELYRSMESYQNTFSSKDILVLDSENMNYLNKFFRIDKSSKKG
ncbi:MAG TPA: protease modulator HflC [Gammaproteobacteria bacterium]|nr:protease modulator HflC [Gammaproteobacteria bacterium]